MKKNYITIICLFVFFIILVFSIYRNHQSVKDENSEQTLEVYFVNPATNSLDGEKRILQGTTVDDKVAEILNILLVTGPLNKSLRVPTKTELSLIDATIDGDTVSVYFDENYNNLDSTDKIYLKSAITWSLTSINEINYVTFYVGDEVIPTYSNNQATAEENLNKYDRSYVTIDPIIDPVNSILINLSLYFVDETTGYLNEEQRLNVYADPNTLKEYYVVDELIKGSTSDQFTSVIPTSTKIINVETDNNICYVNLSSEFVDKQQDNEDINKLSVYQIVNSLTLLDSVDSVQILIDSKKTKGFKNDVDLRQVYTRDDSFIAEKLEEE